MRMLFYLMFRIYWFYIDRRIERDIPLFYISLAVTALICFNINTAYVFLNCLHLVRDIRTFLPNKFYVLIPTAVIWSIIYFGVAKPKRFLKCNFEKTRKGGFAVIGYMVLTAVVFVLVANLNRARLAEEALLNPVKNEHVKETKPSLEGKIRKWFNGD